MYRDEKPHKFWTIACSATALCVHCGKPGTIGKSIEEFASQEACQKQAQKWIAAKIKNG